MLKCGGIGFLHSGQKEAGNTTDNLRGSRKMQTFKKLPIMLPNINTKTDINDFIWLKSIRVVTKRSITSFIPKFGKSKSYFIFSSLIHINLKIFPVLYFSKCFKIKTFRLCEKIIFKIKHFFIDKNRTFFYIVKKVKKGLKIIFKPTKQKRR